MATMYIAGEWQQAASSDTLECIDPATGEVFDHIPDAGQADVDRAVRAASEAFVGWRRMSGMDRAEILENIAHGIAARRHDLAKLETRDNGKPLAESFMGTAWIVRATTSFPVPLSPVMRIRLPVSIPFFRAEKIALWRASIRASRRLRER